MNKWEVWNTIKIKQDFKKKEEKVALRFFKWLIEPKYFLTECTKTSFSYIQKDKPLKNSALFTGEPGRNYFWFSHFKRKMHEMSSRTLKIAFSTFLNQINSASVQEAEGPLTYSFYKVLV